VRKALQPTIERAEASLIRYQLKRAVGGSGVSFVDVIVADLIDSEGVSGLGFSYVLAADGALSCQAAKSHLDQFVRGKPIVPPQALWKLICRSFNRTGLGPNLLGLAAIDVAMWDLYSKRMNMPLAAAMGGEARTIGVYGSGGFTADQSPTEAAENAAMYFEQGFEAVKPRVRGARSDEGVLTAVLSAAGSRGHVMADANERCDLTGARWLLAMARDHGLLFVEEPLPATALSGYYALSKIGVSLAAGEHFQQLETFSLLMSQKILSVIQPDLAMIGGLTPILDLCVLASAMDIVVSPHFLPGLFVHVAAASPALRWLEDFPLIEPMFDGWPEMKDGKVTACETAGHGLSLSARFREMAI
jgi:L-alanine-DL-glutamate epimerase-like enolase superfamily enzyme